MSKSSKKYKPDKAAVKEGGCWSRVFAQVDPEVEARKLEEEKTKAAMQDMFKSHDGDNSGSLDAAEMADLLKSLGFGLDDDQIEGVLEEMRFHSGDRDEFDFDAFMKIVGARNGVKDLEMKQVWPMFDRDGDGLLERNEVEDALIQCGIVMDNNDLDRLWSAADADSSGSITFDEFAQASGDEIWKKAIAMMTIKKDFVNRCMSIAQKQKQWIELLEEREDADFLVNRAKVMRRCALRESVQVKDAIWHLWTVLEGLRTAGDGVVGKQLFQTYFMKISKIVLTDDFDKDEMMEMAEEEWDRQAKRCLEKQQSEGKSSAAEVNDGGIDYDVFFESMFELLDYEVSRRGEKFIEVATYAGFVRGIINQLVVEKISNGTKKWQKGQPVTEREKLGKNYVWLHPDEFNYTGKTDVWESVDREQEKILIAKEAGEVLADEKRQKAKLSGTAPACAAMKAVGGNPKALFDRIDEDGSGVLEYDEIQGHLSDEGIDDATIEMLIIQMDINGDGVIDKEEFINGYGKYNDVVRSQYNKDRYGGTLQLSSPAPVQAKNKEKKTGGKNK